MIGIKITKKIFITGSIEIVTGLCIGGRDTGLEIGGIDKMIVRNPFDLKPYIPGSSLKGKMRSLLERRHGNMYINLTAFANRNGERREKRTEGPFHSCADVPREILNKRQGEDEIVVTGMACRCGSCDICRVFGTAVDKDRLGIPARLIVRDSHLLDPDDKLRDSKFTDIPYTELKIENTIDRIRSEAVPRQFERVPAGASFGLDLVCNVFEDDPEEENLKLILEGLATVADDYLGGSGSRGYGKVEFNLQPITYKDDDCYKNFLESKDYTFSSGFNYRNVFQ